MMILDSSRFTQFCWGKSRFAGFAGSRDARFRAALTVPVMALLLMLSVVHAPSAQAQTCPFDDGNSSIEIEGLILTRFALGLTGAPLVANTVINAVDAPHG